ncbi:uncharacterized protein LOC126981179 [Eriocheir sinensis]|uniref:uncharacterized protein LOC126981179 n=1 Tax=Eriocheir sinensis TaxID=95602 RepID=UPI0021C89EF3|nr:uncharacterized protein LOC126981179 [Eriocheir sinensis]
MDIQRALHCVWRILSTASRVTTAAPSRWPHKLHARCSQPAPRCHPGCRPGAPPCTPPGEGRQTAEINEVDRLGQMTEECGGLDKTEDCSTTTTRPCTRRPWMDIIEKCSGEEEGPEVSSTTSGQAYDFSAVNNVPEGGFSF